MIEKRGRWGGHRVRLHVLFAEADALADHQANRGVQAHLAGLGRHGNRSVCGGKGVARLDIENRRLGRGFVGRAIELGRQARDGGSVVEQHAIDGGQGQTIGKKEGLSLHNVYLVNMVIINAEQGLRQPH